MNLLSRTGVEGGQGVGKKKREAQCVAPLSLALATIVDENSIIETSKQSVLKKPNNSVIRRESYVNLVRYKRIHFSGDLLQD